MTHPITKTPETTAAFDPTKQGSSMRCACCGNPMRQDAITRDWYCDFEGPVHDAAEEALRNSATTPPAPDTEKVESDDAAFVERMAREAAAIEDDSAPQKDFERAIALMREALARRATTKSETDGVTELRDSLEEILDYRGGAENALEDEYVIDRARAALARTPADGERPLVARACLLQTRGQHPHTALPCTQCHFGPCEVCL